MIREYSVVLQTLIATIYTWALTALGAGLVIFIRGYHQKVLDVSLGFAAGVMTAASFWSLLEPAIETVKENNLFDLDHKFAFVPASIGFFSGALFVYYTDAFISKYSFHPSESNVVLKKHETKSDTEMLNADENEDGHGDGEDGTNKRIVKGTETFEITDSRKNSEENSLNRKSSSSMTSNIHTSLVHDKRWKRVVLLIVAITVHNIPEGMAVGVAFAAVGTSTKSTFERARNLAIGIGIQNFPEGLAVSLPLQAAGFSTWRSFWYGQLSGMVEPIFGVIGAISLSYTKPLLPFALAFAAGAMIYVVIDDIIPEASSRSNNKLASWSAIFGFILMMCLDVGLGDEVVA